MLKKAGLEGFDIVPFSGPSTKRIQAQIRLGYDFTPMLSGPKISGLSWRYVDLKRKALGGILLGFSSA